MNLLAIPLISPQENHKSREFTSVSLSFSHFQMVSCSWTLFHKHAFQNFSGMTGESCKGEREYSMKKMCVDGRKTSKSFLAVKTNPQGHVPKTTTFSPISLVYSTLSGMEGWRRGRHDVRRQGWCVCAHLTLWMVHGGVNEREKGKRQKGEQEPLRQGWRSHTIS